MTYRVQRSCGHGWEGKADHLPVPALNTLTPMVHPAAVPCFHGSSCLHPPNRFLSAAEPPIVRRCAAFVQQSEGNYVKQFK